MILTCPACSGRFLVNDAVFGVKARTVRCGKCAHQWLAEPPSAASVIAAAHGIAPPDLPAEKPQAPQAAGFEAAMRDAAREPIESGRADVGGTGGSRTHEGGPGRGPIPPERTAPPLPELPSASPPAMPAQLPVAVRDKSLWQRIVGVLPHQIRQPVRIAAVLICIGLAGFGVRLVLDLAGIHFSLHGTAVAGAGLSIQNVRSEQKTEAGQPRLFVEGLISNDSDGPIKVPDVVVTGRDRQGNDHGHWNAQVKEEALDPGQVTVFQAIIDQPDPTIVDVAVAFADH